ncbi:capsule biosynthesis protein [Yoonia sp. 208BN28-4]|uniref:capsule biosynthesis protein n=1 Tax=Yoonia sp. 208BN28-4 TaxID=3126505 RepID=UPI00309E60C2
MTTKPKAKKFRIRRGVSMASDSAAQETPVAAQEPQRRVAGGGDVATPAQVAGEATLDDIRKEGLTGRQLRMARRVAQKNGLAVASDFDAVRQLRAAGIDPFQRNTILELVTPEGGENAPAAAAGVAAAKTGDDGKKELGRIQLPQTVPQGGQNLPSTETVSPADTRASEIMKIQRDLTKRRRRRFFLLMTRLSAFVFLPTIAVAWYYYAMATPMFATKSEFVIQQADSATGGAGLGGLFQGTGMATQQDSITVQSYLASRAAMQRLNDDLGFKEHFSSPDIDPIQRLEPDATNEAAFGVYEDMVKISYDPTEGILRMEVIAADPETSQEFSEALIGYAEEQVDQLTRRLREDQMAGATLSFESAQARRAEALDRLTELQAQSEILDPVSESGALLQRITNLEIERDARELELQSLLDNTRPNEARVNQARAAIGRLDDSINNLRSQLASTGDQSGTLANITAELRKAEENYQTELLMLQTAQTQMEAAQIEANRQVRYLSLGVEPVAPDEATYPRAFENTVLAFLIFCGIYLMISLTASILREQVTN